MKKQPNLIFMLIDDMGWRDLGCTGSSFYETPHIDRLAKEGMRFPEAYAACPVCSPSRASFLTGKYPARLHLTQYIGGHSQGKLLDVPYIDHLPTEEFSLAKALKQEGYKTWHVGKWHLGEREFYPDRQGFDCNIGGCSWGHPRMGYFWPWGIETLPGGKEGDFLTDRLTDEAISLIQSNDETPFFLYFAQYAVHTPVEAKPEDIARFEEKARRMGLDRTDPFVEGEKFSCEHKKGQHVLRRTVQSDPAYAALIYNLDWNVGRLVDALKEKGIYDDTVIVFTSDNGGLSSAEGSPTCNAPLSEGKGWVYDGGVREPLIVRADFIQPDTLCETPVITPDFYPTFLELAGADLLPEQHRDGVSLLPLLRGETEGDNPIFTRDAIFWHYPHYSNQGGCPAAAVRCGEWKLIRFFEDDHTELYHLPSDPSESFNLTEKEPEITKVLWEKLSAWLEEADASLPAENPDFRG